jgi:hypothetical protein
MVETVNDYSIEVMFSHDYDKAFFLATPPLDPSIGRRKAKIYHNEKQCVQEDSFDVAPNIF